MNSSITTKPNTSTSTWTTNGAACANLHEVFEDIRRRGYEAVLLESGEETKGYSFIGIVNPEIKVPIGEEGLLFMRDFLRKNKRPKKPGTPPFTQGFVGFLSYDLGGKWMEVQKSGVRSRKPEVCPEAYFVYVDRVIAVQEGRASAFCHPELSLPRACRGEGSHAGAPHSNLTKEQYFQKIAAIKDYLYAGETYQVNFSQRFETNFSGDAFAIYKKLAIINPSPFQFFMETPNFAVISNSPERLFRVMVREPHHDTLIETRPIKGTVPRRRNLEEDKKQIQKLLESEKDRAELAMIVDLSRNDLGKICVPGTVEVTAEHTIEKYSHVIHTAANIHGVLSDTHDWYDALRALFPGGSITGCPKKRTMEIIDELEEVNRGIYCGSAGYIDLSGECDFNIMIRTMWLDKTNQKLAFHSGGGIVVDSDPEKEYEETLHKAGAMLNVLHG